MNYESPPVDQLLLVLREEISCLKQFLRLNAAKKKVLIQGDRERLETLTEQEHSLLIPLEQHSKRQRSLLQTLRQSQDSTNPSPPDLLSLIRQVAPQKVHAFESLLQELKQLNDQLIENVQTNILLIEQGIKVSRFLVDVLLENQKQPTYTPYEFRRVSSSQFRVYSS